MAGDDRRADVAGGGAVGEPAGVRETWRRQAAVGPDLQLLELGRDGYPRGDASAVGAPVTAWAAPDVPGPVGLSTGAP